MRSRFAFLFGAALALLTVTLGLLAGQHAAQFLEGRSANLAQVLFAEGR